MLEPQSLDPPNGMGEATTTAIRHDHGTAAAAERSKSNHRLAPGKNGGVEQPFPIVQINAALFDTWNATPGERTFIAATRPVAHQGIRPMIFRPRSRRLQSRRLFQGRISCSHQLELRR